MLPAYIRTYMILSGSNGGLNTGWWASFKCVGLTMAKRQYASRQMIRQTIMATKQLERFWHIPSEVPIEPMGNQGAVSTPASMHTDTKFKLQSHIWRVFTSIYSTNFHWYFMQVWNKILMTRNKKKFKLHILRVSRKYQIWFYIYHYSLKGLWWAYIKFSVRTLL